MTLTADERQELEELRATFDLCWAADKRAVGLWRATTGETLKWPDHVTLQLWLLTRLAAAEAVIDAGRALGKIKIQKDEPLTDWPALGLNLALHIAAYDAEYPERVHLLEARNGH